MSLLTFTLSILLLLLLACTLGLVVYFLVQGLVSVPWVRTRGRVAGRMLELAGFAPGMRVLDLGSGDGSIVFKAVDMGGEGIGMEHLWPLVWYAQLRSTFFGRGKATFVRGDIFKDELPKADIVTTYLFTEVNARVEPRLRERFPSGTRVVSRDFEFPTLRKVVTEPCGGSRIHVYEI